MFIVIMINKRIQLKTVLNAYHMMRGLSPFKKIRIHVLLQFRTRYDSNPRFSKVSNRSTTG